MNPIFQPAENISSQCEFTLLKEEKEDLQNNLKMLEASTDVLRVKWLEGEVRKLRGLLNVMKKKVKYLEEERKWLKELVDHQEGKILKMEILQEEVERLDTMNKLMWGCTKDSELL